MPGTQPKKHNKKVIKNEPQPLSITAKGGKITHKITRQILILIFKKINLQAISITFEGYVTQK